jgi:SM-20-related protein
LNHACFIGGCSYDIDDNKRANKYECYELGLPTYTLSKLQTQASELVKVESDPDRWLSKMGMLDATTLFDFLVLPNFFDEQRSAEIVAEMRSAPGAQAPVYGQSLSRGIDERVRKAVRQTPSAETVQYVQQRLLECKREVEEHFSISLSESEEPQFLRYRVGDFFVAHQDGNTGLIRMDSEARRVSVVIFLNEQSDAPQEGTYCGGSLVFHDWRGGRGSGELRQAYQPGTFVAFRSETTHEVTPVTDGERYTIVGWYR